MSNINLVDYEPWPELSSLEFSKTSHLLHMSVQAIGKLMLLKPFEPHWANLAMPLTSRGITTGMIAYQSGLFSVDVDFIDHEVICASTWGKAARIKLESMPVADFVAQLFKALKSMDINVTINSKPQEVSNPIFFDKDITQQVYDKKTVNAWWRIMASTYQVLQKYHAKFYGISPTIGLFWGTLDLRDARYKGLHLPTTTGMSGFITRNSMDDAQVEVGFSSSNEKYPYPSFFAFAYPKPENFELAKIQPTAAKWVAAINEFVFDYKDLRNSKDPDNDLLLFFETSYRAVAELDQWDPKLIVPGQPT